MTGQDATLRERVAALRPSVFDRSDARYREGFEDAITEVLALLDVPEPDTRCVFCRGTHPADLDHCICPAPEPDTRAEVHRECGHLWVSHDDDGVQMLCPDLPAPAVAEGTDARHDDEWALTYARTYWQHGNEPESQAALTILARLAQRAGCECWPTPESEHYVYYGATEPGSAIEQNPDCPVHPAHPAPAVAEGTDARHTSGRPHNDRDGSCICDYNPDTTDGPQEDCPFHGRPYAYWVERVDTLSARLAQRAPRASVLDREALGREVREVWVQWATEQDDPKPSWLVPWEGLSEPDREVDRRIGEALYRRGRAAQRAPRAEDVDALARLDDAITRWENKGPTSLTVALLAEVAYAARDAITSPMAQGVERGRDLAQRAPRAEDVVLHEAADNMPLRRPGQPYEYASEWLHRRADLFAQRDATPDGGAS